MTKPRLLINDIFFIGYTTLTLCEEFFGVLGLLFFFLFFFFFGLTVELPVYFNLIKIN